MFWASEILSICNFGVNGSLEVVVHVKIGLWIFCWVLNSSILVLAQNALAGCQSVFK